jgi:hypothetical protein
MKRMTKIVALAAIAIVSTTSLGSVTDAQASTISRANAVRAAQNYVRIMPFSLKGLIHQLKYEGYSNSDAAFGASHSGANWNKEAVEAAKGYLRTMPFSRTSLIHQLEYEGYTHSQALHGVRATGL